MKEVKATKINSLEELRELCRDDWSNNACLGYAITAMEYMGLNENEVKRMVGHMKYAFDMKTIDEADKKYCESPY